MASAFTSSNVENWTSSTATGLDHHGNPIFIVLYYLEANRLTVA
jgi:hypothetical protein